MTDKDSGSQLEMKSATEQLEYFKYMRKYVRSKITKKCGQVMLSDDLDTLTANIEILDALQTEISGYDSDIRRLLFSSIKDKKELDAELEKCDQYLDNLSDTKRSLKAKIKSISDMGMASTSFVEDRGPQPGLTTPRLANQIKLPNLPLPEYSNLEGECLETFLSQYENIVKKYNLNNYEMYVFLLKQLSKEPLALVKSLHGDNQSYNEAKKLLQQAFASPIKQKHDVINQLHTLNLSNPNLVYTYISDIRTIVQTFTRLDINIDDVLRYFVWASMPKILQDQFIAITNSNHPSLDQINDNIFDAAERYNNLRKVNKPINVKSFTATESDTVGLAANIPHVNSKNKPAGSFRYHNCVLCEDSKKNADHPIHQCTNFESNEQKIDMLSKMKACVACGYTNHDVSNCYFRFKKVCIFCQGKHFNFLCPKPTNNACSNPTGFQRKVEKTNVHKVTVQSEVLFSNNNTKTILPTFTSQLPDGSLLRCLKDSGCQKTFISDKIVKINNFKIIEKNITLTIEGFNSQQTYHVDLVEVPLKIGEKWEIVHAICVPDIKIDLFLPNLKIVTEKFIDNKFCLADQLLASETDHVSNIGMIVGSNYFHLLPGRDVIYGRGKCPSMYSETPIGIVLYGEIQQILPNLHYLESNSVVNFTAQVDEMKPEAVEGSSTNIIDENEVIETNIANDIGGISFKHENLYTNSLLSLDMNDDYNLTNTIINESNFQNLNKYCHELLNIDTDLVNENAIDAQADIIDHALDVTTRDETGRLIMPILWDKVNCKNLANNSYLSKQILESQRRKFDKMPDKLNMIDLVIKDQLEQGVVSKIPDLDQFRADNPDYSFIPHKPVFKIHNDTTKCRVVYMSNLCAKGTNKVNLSHNQTINTGPPLNSKMSTAFKWLRFDTRLLIYDIKKVSLQIRLYPEDIKKLCFLWYQDVSCVDYSIVGYSMTRVPFGLRCSPCLLMLALYKILIMDTDGDTHEIITEPLTEPVNYPMGIVESITINELGEVTRGKVRKGSNRELVERHSSSLIPILSVEEYGGTVAKLVCNENPKPTFVRRKCNRRAALESIERTKEMLDGDLA